MKRVDLAIIGGGPAGLAAALAAWDSGVRSLVILERDEVLGGILNQCIHNGFGLQRFKEELTGPEYAERDIEEVKQRGIPYLVNTMVLDITPNKQIHCTSPQDGYQVFEARAIILAMGSRERARGAIGTPGTRPAGVLTAGAAQRYLNLEGLAIGKKIVILGSGDIGLIMARRLTLEGAEVLACVEVMPEPGGLTRNIVQCLNDFDIPLLLSHTVTRIEGSRRVEAVWIAKVDLNLRPLPGTERRIECDTLLLSVGLIPENELSRACGITLDSRTKGARVNNYLETSVPGVFACGNVLHIHDLVDYVSEEAKRAGQEAARYLALAKAEPSQTIPVTAGSGLRYTIPQQLSKREKPEALDIFFRVTHTAEDQRIVAESGGVRLATFRRIHVAPGEMEKITLAPHLVEKIDPTGITISLEAAL